MECLRETEIELILHAGIHTVPLIIALYILYSIRVDFTFQLFFAL